MSSRKEQVCREAPVDNECFLLLGPVLHCIGSSSIQYILLFGVHEQVSFGFFCRILLFCFILASSLRFVMGFFYFSGSVYQCG